MRALVRSARECPNLVGHPDRAGDGRPRPVAGRPLVRSTGMKLFGLLIAFALLGCNSGLESYGDDLTDSQVPARGSTDIQTWLAAGYYLGWHCEAEPHPARPPGAH